jgi:beta-lactamase class A
MSGGIRLALVVLCVAAAIGVPVYASGRAHDQAAVTPQTPAAVAGVVHAGTESPELVPADPLKPAAAYLAGRSGTVSVAVYDLATHQTWTTGHSGRAQDEASVVKVEILEALLARHPAGLTSAQRALAGQMIEDSDNDAATALWDADGGAAGIRAFDKRIGLTGTTPSACVQCADFPWPGWGLTTTTPQDQVTLLRELMSSRSVLSAAARKFALRLMQDVTPDQRWGISGGVPRQAKVALKDGWLPLDAADTDWQINSIGWVSGLGRNYLIAVLSTGNPSEAYGISTIDEVSAIIWRQLADRNRG